MANILEQFVISPVVKDYKSGIIIGVQSNNIFLVRTSSGLILTIQDNSIDYVIGDSVILATSNNSINNAFIIKKTNTIGPSSVNFVVDNNLN